MTGARHRLDGGLGPSFWRLLAASAVSNLGDGIFWLALPLLAIGLTDSPALVAGVAAAARLPWLVFALVSGALVDRVDRRRAMVGVDIIRVAVIALLAVAVAAGWASIWLLYLAALVLGTLETVFDTAAQAVVPVIVPDRARLSLANGRLFAVEILANNFLGPPIGGYLAALAASAAFGVTAAGFLGAALLLATLPGSFRPVRTGPPSSVRQDVAEGIRYLAANRVLRSVAIVVSIANFAAGAQQGVLVLYAVAPGPMGLDPVGYGLLFTVLAAGTLTGTLLATRVERRIGKAGILTATVAGMAAQHLVLALSANPYLVAAVIFAGWFMQGAFYPVFVSLRQRMVPDRLLGRVVATFRVMAVGTLPAGALVGGLIAEWLGLQAVFLFAFLVTIALLPLRLVITERALLEAEAAGDAEAAREHAAASGAEAVSSGVRPAR